MDYTNTMLNLFFRIRDYLEVLLPPESPRRKVVQILSVILVFEGLSVIVLFTYAALWLGLLSLCIGVVLLTLLRSAIVENDHLVESPGIRLIDYLVRMVGGEYAVMVIGAIVVAAVVFYNQFVSNRPDLGDVDTISIMFGMVLMLHPLLYERFKVEMGFTTLFVGTIAILLALPQILQSFSSESNSSIAGDWYVHYMLAAPFAGILELIGIHSSSSGNLVTIQFQDGSLHTLSISAYCAGLYSFSIFLAAFLAFVLVFESLSKKVSAIVLALGLLVAYLGNILRMVVVGVVGYSRGIDDMLWAHENVGWIIFLAWSSVFWYIIVNYADKRKTRMHAGGVNQ